MMRSLFLMLLLCIGNMAFAQVGKTFPSITTEKVSGEEVQVPKEFAGSYALIGIGTSKKAEDELRTWQNPVYNKFVRKSGILDDFYDVKVCFLPLFTGASQAAKSKVIKELKEKNESLVIDNVYIYSGSRQPFNDIGVGDKSEPTFVLINGQGKILWEAKGEFKQKYFEEIETILNR